VQRLLILAAGSCLLAHAACAHAMLDRADPAVGATLSASPAQLSLRYTEAVEPLFSQVTVTNAQGARMEQGSPVAQQDNYVLVVPLRTLPPGTYAVEWHVTSVDTHRTSGHFTFTIRP
jgi:copper resistance protein C